MASTYSSLKIELIGTGDQSGTWGTTTNTNLGTAIEEAITGSADVTFSSADVTLTLTNTNTTQTARNLRLNLIGTSGGARNLTVPDIEKYYIIKNGLADIVTVKNSTGSTYSIPAGVTAQVYSTGTGIDDALSFFDGAILSSAAVISGGAINGTTIGASSPNTGAFTTLTASTPVGVASGGTGASTAAAAPFALKGANSDITSLSGLTTPLSIAQGGTGATTLAGANIALTNSSNTFTALQSFSGSSSSLASYFINGGEKVTYTITGIGGTLNYDIATQSVYFSNAATTGNWTVNFRGSSGATLDSMLSTGECVTAVVVANNATNTYVNNVVQIDGTAISPYWSGGVVPTTGYTGLNAYTYTIIKTGSASFIVLGSLVWFSL